MEHGVSEFGVLLRELREARGWRQQDLSEALDNKFARSSLANIESGREPPSARFWALLGEHLPDWQTRLTSAYEATGARQDRHREPTSVTAIRTGSDAGDDPPVLGGPFTIEKLKLIYVFRHSKAPEEILEIRQVRAQRNGANRYGLKLTSTDSSELSIDEEAIFGGHLETTTHHRVGQHTIYLRSFEFDQALRRGQSHEFAVRSWVDQGPIATAVNVDLTLPVKDVAIHLNFFGPATPNALWSYGPVGDSDLVPTDPDASGARTLPLQPSGTASLYLSNPQTGPTYGIGWQWPD